jgi:hypothetical protein
LEPARTRRYLLRWREKFRQGIYGIGGDMKYVTDGVAELRVCEVPRLPGADGTVKMVAGVNETPGMVKVVLNVPQGAKGYVLEEGQGTGDLRKPEGIKLKEGRMITGRYVQMVKGKEGESVARLKVEEGMWEDKLGRKVNGGERRRAQVLHKRRVEENNKARR